MSGTGIKYEFIGTEGTGEDLSVVFSRHNDNAPPGHRETLLVINGTNYMRRDYAKEWKIPYNAAKDAAVAAIVNDVAVPEKPVPDKFKLTF